MYLAARRAPSFRESRLKTKKKVTWLSTFLWAVLYSSGIALFPFISAFQGFIGFENDVGAASLLVIYLELCSFIISRIHSEIKKASPHTKTPSYPKRTRKANFLIRACFEKENSAAVCDKRSSSLKGEAFITDPVVCQKDILRTS